MVTEDEFRNPMDALVIASVRRLVGDATVGIDDDFFAIGGNSIVAMRLGQILSEKLGIARPARVIFRNPVLGDLSDALSELTGRPT
ncbi:phosphopantetheine-binding protein [Dactylosporangium sp. NPDC000244]|uniref:phosphopantetheine-binding protein n=1 Tax=Dactylosporangium sp. NPDC000244 TaxID=3154365 RepID=UPI0033329B23